MSPDTKEVVADEAFDRQMVFELLDKNSYDIILMDLIMPKMNGFETTLKIRSEFSEDKKNTVILALTSSADQSEVARLIDVFLTKIPVSIQKLYQALSDNEFDSIRVIAHSMKPQLHSAGMSQALENASLIEESCIEKNTLSQLPELIKNLDLICQKAILEIRNL